MDRNKQRDDKVAEGARFRLRLFVAGDAPNSTAAVANLRRACEDYLMGRYDIEIVDVLEDPDRALAENVLVTPTLIKLAPPPVARILGNLEETEELVTALGLEGAADE